MTDPDEYNRIDLNEVIEALRQRVKELEEKASDASAMADAQILALKQGQGEPVTFQEFNEWMNKELPSGTIIGDAGWWASRIYKLFIAAPKLGER